jgi:hypothetical protein
MLLVVVFFAIPHMLSYFIYCHIIQVPHVDRQDYQLIDIAEDGFISLLTESGDTKDDLKLPTDDALLTQVGAIAMKAC